MVGMILRAGTEVIYSKKTLFQCHLLVTVMSVTMIADIVGELCFFCFRENWAQ